ncbi:MAG TPA: energy transducer TonB [Burkholderiales bacterium]
MILEGRVSLALGVSLLLHGAALALADRLPIGWQRAAPDRGTWGSGVLHARMGKLAQDAPSAAAQPRAPVRATRENADARHAAPALPGVIAAADYLPAEQLDERPQIRSHVAPAFPPEADAPAGRVVLRLLIGETGVVDKALVVRADPPGPFAAAAVEAFAPARFSPGRKDGVAVRSALTLELRFGEAPAAGAGLRQQDLPLFQPPRLAPRNRSVSAQEKP